MSNRIGALLSLPVLLSVATAGPPARAQAPPAAPPAAPAATASAPDPAEAYERGSGGFAVELSTGGLSSGTLQGGILVGIGVRGFVGGLFVDALQEATSPAVPPNTTETSTGSSRLGVAARVPLIRTADGRVSLFAGLDAALTHRNVPATSTDAKYQADGTTWSLGPGLRFWLTEHLSLAYLTRLRFTSLEGDAGALPDVIAAADPSTQSSASYVQLEGSFQFLCVF
jgi:hypothetical protein